MTVKIVKRGCPVCHSDVKGDALNKYYCKHCNILYSEKDLRKGEVKEIVEAEKVSDGAITREKGHIYFVDKEGDVSRVAMAKNRADKGPKEHEKVKKFGISKEKGYFYFIDSQGYVARTPMKRGKK